MQLAVSHRQTMGTFLMKLVLVFTCILCLEAADWKTTSAYALFTITPVKNVIDMSIVNSTQKVRSALDCSSVCLSATSLYFNPLTSQCWCNHGLDENIITVEDTADGAIYYGYRQQSFEKQTRAGSNGEPEMSRYLPTSGIHANCDSLYRNGFATDGVYSISADGVDETDVYCDMTSGGWTVVQKRQDNTVDFDRNWNDYVNGFGSVTGEFWLGLDTIFKLTQNGNCMLYIYLEAEPGNAVKASGYAQYGNFQISGPEDFYRLNISDFSGDVGDSMEYHNGQQFTAKDEDHDQLWHGTNNCAVSYHGAWWYNICYRVNLNGKYGGPPDSCDSGVHWKTGPWYGCHSIPKVEMKIKCDK